MPTLIFSAPANLGLVLMLLFNRFAGDLEDFGDFGGGCSLWRGAWDGSAAGLVLGMGWRLPLTHCWVGLGAEAAPGCGWGTLVLAKFSPGQGGSLNFGAPGGGTLHPEPTALPEDYSWHRGSWKAQGAGGEVFLQCSQPGFLREPPMLCPAHWTPL